MPDDILLGVGETQHKSEVPLKRYFSLRVFKKVRVVAQIMGILALALGVLGISSASSASSAKPAATVHRPVSGSSADGPVVNWTNTLAANKNGWCVDVPPNAPCDGQIGDYGTIDVVSHKFTEIMAGTPLKLPGQHRLLTVVFRAPVRPRASLIPCPAARPRGARTAPVPSPSSDRTMMAPTMSSRRTGSPRRSRSTLTPLGRVTTRAI